MYVVYNTMCMWYTKARPCGMSGILIWHGNCIKQHLMLRLISMWSGVIHAEDRIVHLISVFPVVPPRLILIVSLYLVTIVTMSTNHGYCLCKYYGARSSYGYRIRWDIQHGRTLIPFTLLKARGTVSQIARDPRPPLWSEIYRPGLVETWEESKAATYRDLNVPLWGLMCLLCKIYDRKAAQSGTAQIPVYVDNGCQFSGAVRAVIR